MQNLGIAVVVVVGLIAIFLFSNNNAVFCDELCQQTQADRRAGFPQKRASLGTPGSGYVRGAPTTPEECVRRHGTNTGRGCKDYR